MVRHCIYGVDLNHLAVELCRLGLWLESMEPGRPLGFLDHRIRHGNALLGLQRPDQVREPIPDEAYKELLGDDKDSAKALKKKNRAGVGQLSLAFGKDTALSFRLRGAVDLDAMDEDSLEAVAAKRARWLAERSRPEHLRERLRADCYVAAFLAPKLPTTLELVPTAHELNELRLGHALPRPLQDFVEDLAERHRFFHWHLEFPEAHAQGGFDCVLGNPPWERLQFEEREYFARLEAIAKAPNAAVRKQRIAALAQQDPSLFHAYIADKHAVDGAGQFLRSGGRFPLTARGELNLYPLFAEHALNLIAKHGQAGVIVPTGIATDDSTSLFFAHLTAHQRLKNIFDFENGKIFPAVDSRMRFSLLTLTTGEQNPEFSFFNREIAHLEDPRRRFRIRTDEIAMLNPNTGNAPAFRTERDAEITKKLYRAGQILVDEKLPRERNPWQVELCRFLNMADDSDKFETFKGLLAKGATFTPPNWQLEGQTYVPLYEGKMVHHYDHRFQGFDQDGVSIPDSGTAALSRHPDYAPLPRYWVPESLLPPFFARRGWPHRWLLGWRDVTNATNERTTIACAFPLAAVNHKLPLIFPNIDPEKIPCLIALLSSLAFDFVARQKIGGTSMSQFILKQLPVLPPEAFSAEEVAYIRERVLVLVYTSHVLAPFARDLGHEGGPFPFQEAERYALRAELDACIAHKFGLTYDELAYILDPTVLGEDFPSETFRVLKDNEIRRFGHYRTRDTVLRAFRERSFPPYKP